MIPLKMRITNSRETENKNKSKYHVYDFKVNLYI